MMRHWSSSIRSRTRRTLWRLKPPILAFGGGGARGFAHIGVLREIDHAGLPVDRIVGTSMGAVVGAMYQSLGSADAVLERWREAFAEDLLPKVTSARRLNRRTAENPLLQAARRFKNRMVVSFALHRTSMMEDETIVKALDFLIPDGLIEDLEKPLTVVATDLDTGQPVCLEQGPLREVVRASSSIPGILPSVHLNDRALVDGGVVAEVPVIAARNKGKQVLAVDVSADLPARDPEEIALDTIMRTQLMTARLLLHRHLAHARWVIRPPVGHAVWSDWDDFDELVETGASAMRQWLEASEPPA